MTVPYPDGAPLREAVRRYFEANHFGDDGGYGARWVDFKIGRVPMPFPNTPARVRAVRYHDLHHVLTGYDTDLRGEFEISAWEIAAGCRGFGAAWALNLAGMAGGLITCPRREFRAFVRGRRDHTTYGEDYDALLALTVRAARLRYLCPEVTRPSAKDVARFALAVGAGLLVASVLFVLLVPIAPVGFVALRLIHRRLLTG